MDEMRNQNLQVGLRIKQIASLYPGYIFSSYSTDVINLDDNEQKYIYRASAMFGREMISESAYSLEDLYDKFSLKLHLHFKVIPSNQAA